MRHHGRYLKYVIKHKYHVLRAGVKNGVPLWKLVLHDWDKFTPKMWRSYANRFYNFDNLPTDRDVMRASLVCGVAGYNPYTQEQCEREYKETWNRHQHISKHHWQSAVCRNDDGTEEVMEMDDADWREMVSDWEGASASIPNADPLIIWYEKTKPNRKLHPVTQVHVERLLGIPT